MKIWPSRKIIISLCVICNWACNLPRLTYTNRSRRAVRTRDGAILMWKWNFNRIKGRDKTSRAGTNHPWDDVTGGTVISSVSLYFAWLLLCAIPFGTVGTNISVAVPIDKTYVWMKKRNIARRRSPLSPLSFLSVNIVFTDFRSHLGSSHWRPSVHS